MGYLFGLFLLLLPATGAWASSHGLRSCADVALVLAIDASGSIDDREFRLQQHGYEMAFRDETVHVALGAAGRVDVAAVIWGDADFAPQILPFRRLASPRDAEGFAQELGAIPRITTGNTGLGTGLNHALDLLEDPAVCAAQKIIDLSGDGRQMTARGRFGVIPLHSVRQRAEAMGVTINALAIETDERQLSDYFRKRVITGASAFVMRAADFHDFRDAITDKLVRELMAGVPRCSGPDCGG